jgi:hypothetical protein
MNISQKLNKRGCGFVIPRGETSRYIYQFDFQGAYYKVTKKVLYANLPNYVTISIVNIPTKNIMNYINTVVALTY